MFSTPVQINNLGADHWIVLALVESTAVNATTLDRRRMRCNPNRHRHLLDNRLPTIAWDDSYSTRLADGNSLTGHDDWDCLNDLQRLGLIRIDSLVNGQVSPTDLGYQFAHALRKHYAQGGVPATFVPTIS